MYKPRFRTHEWILLSFFAYIAAITPLFQTRPLLHGQPFVLFAVVLASFLVIDRLQKGVLAFGMEIARDWLPILFLLLAFREMNYFAPAQYDFLTEMSWIRWDWILLNGYHVKERIDALGSVLPSYLELCYLLVYTVNFYCVARLSAVAGRKAINRFWNIALLGTLGSYALFPYFPTEPPRFAFPDVAMPSFTSLLRQLNLDLLNRTTIHSGVFPSAHVSCVFSAAWAMLLLLPRGQRDGWFLLFYAVSVGVATVYGRYHYAVDAFAGFGISLLAAALCLLYYAHDVKQDAKLAQ